jgi:hypothetical protein
MVVGFLYAGIFLIISIFKVSDNSWNLSTSKLIIDNSEKQTCVKKTVPV